MEIQQRVIASGKVIRYVDTMWDWKDSPEAEDLTDMVNTMNEAGINFKCYTLGPNDLEQDDYWMVFTDQPLDYGEQLSLFYVSGEEDEDASDLG